MVKNFLLVMMAAFVFVITGCGDNGSAGTSFIDMPVTRGDVEFSVVDGKGLPFIGAELVIMLGGVEFTRLEIEGTDFVFDNVPYGTYTLSIPGYAKESKTVTVNKDYTPQTLVFSRMDVAFSMRVVDGEARGKAGKEYGEFYVALADGIDRTILEIEDIEEDTTSTTYYYGGTVPAGRYYLAVEDRLMAGGIKGEIRFTHHRIVDINENSEPIEVQKDDDSKDYPAEFRIPMPFTGELPEIGLEDRELVFAWFDTYFQEYRAVFALNKSDDEARLKLTVDASGFEYYEKEFNVCTCGQLGDSDVLLTPTGKNETAAIMSFRISKKDGDFTGSETISVVGLTEGPDIPADFIVCFMPTDDDIDYEKRYSGKAYRAVFYLDADEMKEYSSYKATVDALSGTVNRLPLKDTIVDSEIET